MSGEQGVDGLGPLKRAIMACGRTWDSMSMATTCERAEAVASIEAEINALLEAACRAGQEDMLRRAAAVANETQSFGTCARITELPILPYAAIQRGREGEGK